MEIRGVEFWPLPLKWLVTLTTVLRYRAACDDELMRVVSGAINRKNNGTAITVVGLLRSHCILRSRRYKAACSNCRQSAIFANAIVLEPADRPTDQATNGDWPRYDDQGIDHDAVSPSRRKDYLLRPIDAHQQEMCAYTDGSKNDMSQPLTVICCMW